MKIRAIIIYSHDGRVRSVPFNPNGLNIITGRSSTGKSALSEIVEYCMGQSDFNIPEGIIRDRVSWYGVIYQFESGQVLVAKPAPKSDASSCSQAMVRTGADLKIPKFNELVVNSDDDVVVSTLSRLLGIPENRTDVSLEHSRVSFETTIKHVWFYLFQKQGMVASKEQLFYRQNEPFIPQAIKDTLPILLGAGSDERYQLEARLRAARRDLRIQEKLINDARYFLEETNVRGVGLLSEARQVGILDKLGDSLKVEEIVGQLKIASTWKPESLPDEKHGRISTLEDELVELREKRSELSRSLDAAKQFSDKAQNFSDEAAEQRDRLESINALPRNPLTGEWQWPFCEENLGMSSPIADALIGELMSLADEMQMVAGDRPKLDEYIVEKKASIQNISDQIQLKNEELASAIATNEMIAAMGSRNHAAAKVVGRVSLFLEDFKPSDDIDSLDKKKIKLKKLVDSLERKLAIDDSDARLNSILNLISLKVSDYVREFKAEFSEFPFRFDLNKQTLIVDRADRPVPMSKTGGGSNHMAYHVSALLALHFYAAENHRPIPRFLFIDQPTQVYFPSEAIYAEADGSIEKTEEVDADLVAVRRLFELLYRFTTKDCPGFQIIVIEHANLRDQWFQDALAEPPWTKPPALVPEDWPTL